MRDLGSELWADGVGGQLEEIHWERIFIYSDILELSWNPAGWPASQQGRQTAIEIICPR